MSQSPPPNSLAIRLSRLLKIARKPSTIAIGVTSVTIVLIGYTGFRLFLKEYLPPWLEKQVSSLINRPVKIGELQGFSLTRLYFGSTSIPPTSDNPNQLTASGVIVDFNLLAVVLKRTLLIKIIPQEVEVDLRQYPQGELLKLDITAEVIPLKLDLTFDVDQADIDIFSHQKNQPFDVSLSGQARYTDAKQSQWNYALKLALLNSEINLEGTTILETLESQIQLAINKLDFSQLMPLVMDFPLQVKQGNIQANLDLMVPSLDNLAKTQGQGNLNLTNIQGQVKPLKEPLQALAYIAFEKQKVVIKKAQVSLGKITAKITGDYDWKTGSNLAINMTGLTGANLRQVSSVPFPVEGELQAQFNLTGTFDNPLLIGKVNNRNLIEVAQTKVDQIIVSFQTNLDDFVLNNVLIKPQVGGKITAQGKAKPNLRQALVNRTPIDWKKIPFELGLKTQLPTEKVIQDYYNLPLLVNLQPFQAQGTIKGTFAKPKGLIQWQTSGNLRKFNTQVSTQGNLLLENNNFIIRNTEFITNKGKVTFNGSGNLSTRKWQGYLNSTSLNLTPFISTICQSQQIQCPSNINLETANIRLKGIVNETWKKSLDLDSNLALTIGNGNLSINSQLQQGNLTTSAIGLQLPLDFLTTDIPIPIILKNSRFNLVGNIEKIWQNSTLNLNAIQANSNLELSLAESTLTAAGKLENGLFQGVADLASLSINQMLPQLPIPVQLTRSKIQVSGDGRSLLSLRQNPNLNNWQIKADTELAVADGKVTAISQLNQGKISINAQGSPFLLTNILPQLSIPIQVKETQINLTANLSDLLVSNFNQVRGNAQLKLGVDQGEIQTKTELVNNQWQTNIIANNLDLSTLDSQLFSAETSEQLNAKINLSGTLQSLLSPDSIIPLQANQILIEFGKQKLEATGNLTLTNLLINPDIKTINLILDTQADLNSLPITELLAKIPIGKQLLPQTIDLAGTGRLTGILIGNNVLTNPFSPGNLQLKGDLNLSNFRFNNLAFESSLQGKVNLLTGQKLSLDLQGKKDVIAAVFSPCIQVNCLFPYFPDSFTIRQKYNNNSPIIAQGNLQGDRLITTIQNFPLEVLKLAPISNYGFLSFLGGRVNLNLEIDPLTLTGRGNLNIIDPNFGEIFGETFAANWIYKNNLISLKNATLNLGKTRYDVLGSLRLDTGEIVGKLQIDRGYIQDLLTALKVSDFDGLLRVLQLQKEKFTTAKQVIPQSVGNRNAPLSEQINQLWEIEQLIREINNQKQAGNFPRELNLRGEFTTDIIVSGTLTNPQINLQFQGNNWQWTPQTPTPAIINPLGFILEGSQVIPIEKIAIEGKLNDGIIQINPSIGINQSLLQANLNLVQNDQKFTLNQSTFKVKNLTLDTIRTLLVIPGDINGNINLEGSLAGSLEKPEIKGIFSLTNGVVNARLIEENFKGNFAYSNKQLQVGINEPDFIQLAASFPFPIESNNNQFKLNAQLKTEAFSLLEILTQEQIIWLGGEGEIGLNMAGNIFIDDKVKISLDPRSRASFDFQEATFNSDLLPNPLTLNGKIALQNGLIQVGQLIGKIGQQTINTTGVLPLFPNSTEGIESAIPLTLVLTQDQANSDGLYQGIADARIMITGAAISPIIGGEVRLNQGKIVVPEVIPTQTGSPVFEEWLGTISPREGITIPPRLNNFKISLQDVGIEQQKISPKFSFNVSGDVSLNGQLASLSLPGLLTLEPSGTVSVNRGTVNIPVTRVFLPRQYNNKITFLPNQGLLNPSIDLQFKLYIFNVALRTINANEVPDDIVQSGRSQSVEITLGIKGDADQLLPSLGTQLEEVCQLRPDNHPPIPKTPALSVNQLQQLVNCIQANNLGSNSIRDLLQSPIVSFSSSPRLTSSELLTLFGTQTPDLVEQLRQQNSAQLVEAGLPQVAVVVFPFLQDWIFDLNETTNQIGRDWGLGNLRLYPVLETVYELEDDALIRFSYDYSFNEVIIRYENKF